MTPPTEDRGALLGEGLFETVLVRAGTPGHLDAHLARMRASAQALGLPDAGDGARAAIEGFVAEEWPRLGSPLRAALRITLTAGDGRGLVPPGPRAARLSHLLRPLPDAPERRPAYGLVVRAHRVDPQAAASGHKTLSWLPWILARREAVARGGEVALVATVDGDVCEADHANVFAVLGGSVVTPPLDRGVLPGITRARALAALRAAGRPVEERVLLPEDLARASEVFLTSSLDGVRSLGALEWIRLDAPGPVATWLADCLDGV